MNSPFKTSTTSKSLKVRFIALILLISNIGILKAADYYWVGGTGNWSDYANHWATTSGGNVFHVAIPTLNDNVIFDANSFTASFQSVTFDNTFIYCNNMDWTGATNNPSVNGLASKLNVYGSLKLISAMSWSVKRIDFPGSGTGNTIETSGKSLDTLYFNGSGSYGLADPLTCKTINAQSGTFSTNNYPVTVQIFEIGITGNTVNVNTGSSVITVNTTFKAYYGTINLNSSATDLVFANPTTNIYYFWTQNKTFKDIDFQARAEVIGSFTCQHLTAAGIFYINGSSTTSNCDVAELSQSTTLDCTFNVDTLKILASGRYLKIDQLNVADHFESNGICGNPNTIQPIDFNPSGTINKPSGSVVVDYCIITSINATGGATFTANNSIDGGGNSGWTFGSSPSRTLYWVGGTGNWTDQSKWSLSSGGAGGNCIPSSIDDVIFDANSFTQTGESVTLNAVQATCRNFNWSGVTFNPTFTSTGQSNIYINGSMTLSPNMVLTFNTFNFAGSSLGNSIFTAGQLIYQITISGVGEWSLADELNCTAFQVYQGTFNTNNFDVHAQVFSANGIGNSIFVDLGTSTLYISEYYVAFAQDLTINSTNANLVFYNNTGATLYGQLYDATFNDVTVNAYTYFMGKLNCNNFTSTSGVFVTSLNANDAVFHKSFSGRSFFADNMTLMQDVQLFEFDSLEVTGSFLTTTNCNSPLAMKVYSEPLAQFIKTSGAVNINYVYLTRIAASGGAVFTANNSWDAGNNSGWNINSPSARNLYWVGGAGDWSDPAHWALSSNGTPGNCPPNKSDNIFFDSNSISLPGQTINIDPSYNTYCKNLSFSGIPAGTVLMSGSNSPVYIEESLSLVPELDPWALNAEFIGSGSGNTINPGNNNINQLTTAGPGTWDLQGTLNAGNIYFRGGTFNSNNYNITTGGINTGGNTFVDFGTSTVSMLGFYSSSPTVVFDGDSANIVMTSSFLSFEVNNPFFNSITFTGNANTQFNFSCNRLIALGEFVNVNSTINAGYAEFKNKVTLAYPITADTVVFDNPGKLVRINQMTVNDEIIANGNAGFPIQLEGYSGTGTLTKTSGVVCLDHMLIKDINATGGAQFFAGANSVDLGGNSGWNFSVCSPLTVVWPGDANYDLTADNFDILNIGLAYGYTGPVRANASLVWVDQPATDWLYQFADGTNLKHADTDGSGLVDDDDTLAVALNYGLTHPLRIMENQLSSLPAPVLYVVASPDSVSLSDTVNVEVFLGTSALPVDSIYGIAFTLNFDTALVNTNYLTVDFTGCWMGTPQVDLLTFHHNLLTDGKVDFAIVRNDHSNVNGFGFLTRMGIVIVDNVGAKVTMPVFLSDIKAITATEYLLSIGTENDSIVIDTASTVGIHEYINNDFNVSLYPNPVRDNLNINAGDVKLTSYELYDISGKRIESENNIKSNFTINTAHLNQGTYFVRLISNESVVVKKFEVLRK